MESSIMQDLMKRDLEEIWARLRQLDTWQKIQTLLLGVIAGELGADVSGLI